VWYLRLLHHTVLCLEVPLAQILKLLPPQGPLQGPLQDQQAGTVAAVAAVVAVGQGEVIAAMKCHHRQYRSKLRCTMTGVTSLFES
jgi:hypothetical protein